MYGRIMCFVNCHFAAHLEAVNRRNADFDHVYRTMNFCRPNFLNCAAGTSLFLSSIVPLPSQCIYFGLFIDLACHWSFLLQLVLHLQYKFFVAHMYVYTTIGISTFLVFKLLVTGRIFFHQF